jgi:hypothetical protein
VRARLLLWCGDVVAGGVTARGPERGAGTREWWPSSRTLACVTCRERGAGTREWWPQGIASSFLFWLVGKGLRPRAVEREPANRYGRAEGDIPKSYFLGRSLPIGNSLSAGPNRCGGENRAASVRGHGLIRAG